MVFGLYVVHHYFGSYGHLVNTSESFGQQEETAMIGGCSICLHTLTGKPIGCSFHNVNVLLLPLRMNGVSYIHVSVSQIYCKAVNKWPLKMHVK